MFCVCICTTQTVEYVLHGGLEKKVFDKDSKQEMKEETTNC